MQHDALALIECFECKSQISDQAMTCPNCGIPTYLAYKTKRKKDKYIKWFVFYLIGFLLIRIALWMWNLPEESNYHGTTLPVILFLSSIYFFMEPFTVKQRWED